jgi:hypothetical protein
VVRVRQEDIGDIINDAGYENLKKGQVLTFNFEGTLTDYKIMKIDKEGKHVWVKKTKLYDPSEIKIVEKK